MTAFEMDRTSLLERVQSGHSVFVERVKQSLDDSGPSRGPDDPVLVDLLHHILIHQERMLAWLEQSLRDGHPVDTQPYDMPEPELNALNEKIKIEGRSRMVGELLAALDQLHQRVVTFVESAPEAFLFGAGRWSLRGGEPLWMAIAANTYEHYDEHTPELHRAPDC